MHVGHKPLFNYAPQPQPARNTGSDKTTTLEFMRHSAAIAEDLGEGGKKGNRMRGARQESRHRRTEDEGGSGEAAGEATGSPISEAVDGQGLALSDLIGAAGSPKMPQGETLGTAPVKEATGEPSFEELLARAVASS
jgi:hypothetical protein